MQLGSLAVRWVVATAAYFASFIILMDVFVTGVEFSLILKGAILFALIVSTLYVLLMWKKQTRSLSYYDAIFAAGIAGVFLAGAAPSEGESRTVWSFSSLVLVASCIVIGAAGRWLYATALTQGRRLIRRQSMDDSEG